MPGILGIACRRSITKPLLLRVQNIEFIRGQSRPRVIPLLALPVLRFGAVFFACFGSFGIVILLLRVAQILTGLLLRPHRRFVRVGIAAVASRRFASCKAGDREDATRRWQPHRLHRRPATFLGRCNAGQSIGASWPRWICRRETCSGVCRVRICCGTSCPCGSTPRISRSGLGVRASGGRIGSKKPNPANLP